MSANQSATAIDAGVSSFQLTRNGQPDTVVARYSFVREKIDGVWRIQLLHSSLMPEPVAPYNLAPKQPKAVEDPCTTSTPPFCAPLWF